MFIKTEIGHSINTNHIVALNYTEVSKQIDGMNNFVVQAVDIFDKAYYLTRCKTLAEAICFIEELANKINEGMENG